MSNRFSGNGSIRLTVTVSESVNSLLYERLKNCASNGEKPGRVLRGYAEEAMYLEKHSGLNISQLVDSQQVFVKNFINQPSMVMKINDEVKTEDLKTSLTNNQVNEVFEQQKANHSAASDLSENFINQAPVVMKKKSGAREMARLMVARGLV